MGHNVKEEVCRAIGVPFDAPDEYDYRTSGKVDSLGVVRLVLTLESKFGIVFSDENFTRLEFNTVGGLAKIIEEKLNV